MSLDYDKIYNEAKAKAETRLPLVLDMLTAEYLATANVNERVRDTILEYMTFHILAEDNKTHGLYRNIAFSTDIPQKEKVKEILNNWWSSETTGKSARVISAIASIAEGKKPPEIETIRANLQVDLLDGALTLANIYLMDSVGAIGYGNNLIQILADNRVSDLLKFIIESRLMNQLPERHNALKYEELKRDVKSEYGDPVLRDLLQASIDEIDPRMASLGK